MDVLDNYHNGNLLNEIKKNAIRTSSVTMIVSAIDCLEDFAEIAWQKGIAVLAEEIEGYPEDIILFADVIRGVNYILSGVDEEALLQKLSDDYWNNRVRGMNAFIRYLTVIGILKIKEGMEPCELRKLLLEQAKGWSELAWKGEQDCVWAENM